MYRAMIYRATILIVDAMFLRFIKVLADCSHDVYFISSDNGDGC